MGKSEVPCKGHQICHLKSKNILKYHIYRFDPFHHIDRFYIRICLSECTENKNISTHDDCLQGSINSADNILHDNSTTDITQSTSPIYHVNMTRSQTSTNNSEDTNSSISHTSHKSEHTASNTVQFNQSLFIPLTLEHGNESVHSSGYIDSGSDVTIISAKVLMGFQRSLPKLCPTTAVITSASCENLDVLGTVNLHVKIGSATYFITFFCCQ